MTPHIIYRRTKKFLWFLAMVFDDEVLNVGVRRVCLKTSFWKYLSMKISLEKELLAKAQIVGIVSLQMCIIFYKFVRKCLLKVYFSQNWKNEPHFLTKFILIGNLFQKRCFQVHPRRVVIILKNVHGWSEKVCRKKSISET